MFEGRVKSTGMCGMLSEVIDEMAKALFMKFPSGSGNLIIEGKFNCWANAHHATTGLS